MAAYTNQAGIAIISFLAWLSISYDHELLSGIEKAILSSLARFYLATSRDKLSN
jgi:hypothetical protein